MSAETDDQTTFHDRLRSLEARYSVSESERARELGRTVADLRD